MQWPSVRVCYSLRILVEYCLLGLNRDLSTVFFF